MNTRNLGPKVWILMICLMALAVVALAVTPDGDFVVRRIVRGGTNYLAVHFKSYSPRPISFTVTSSGSIVHQIDWMKSGRVDKSDYYETMGEASRGEIRLLNRWREDLFVIPDGVEKVRIGTRYELPTWTAWLLKPLEAIDDILDVRVWLVDKAGWRKSVLKSDTFSIGELPTDRDQKPTVGVSQ